MDPMTIFALIEKGITVAETLISVGESAAPALKVLFGLVTGAQAGTVTDEQLAADEATLDGLIADFNKPME